MFAQEWDFIVSSSSNTGINDYYFKTEELHPLHVTHG